MFRSETKTKKSHDWLKGPDLWGTESGAIDEECSDKLNLNKKNFFNEFFQRKKNPNQICWLYRKVGRTDPPMQRTQTLQEILDGDQYTRRGILKYEKIYGHNFISVGGAKEAQKLLEGLQLKPADYVLDIGAGVGGSAFHMARVCSDAEFPA
jgi:hypothetical protein